MSTLTYAQLVNTNIKLDPDEASSEAEESQPLGFGVPFTSVEFEASKPLGTRTVSSHSPVSLDSTAPLSLDHSLTHVSHTLTPTQVFFHHMTARMAMRTQPTLSPGIGTSELILDTDSEECELGNEDTKEDKGDESSNADDKRERERDEDLGLEEEEVVPEGQQQAFLVVEKAASEPLELGYDLLGRHELAMEEYQPTLDTWVDPKDGRVYTDIPAYVPLYAPVQTSSSPEWSLGSLPVSPSSPCLNALPPTLVTNINKDVRELCTRSGAVRDEIFSQRYATARYDDHRPIHGMLVQQATMQRELQEMRGHVTTLKKERSRREQ
nr:hypothetical protein [Tanacetum cinerariifolium]